MRPILPRNSVSGHAGATQFNNGSFSWGGTTAGNRLAHGRPRLGGASLYAHCEPCRAATSPWDDEYIRWAYTFAGNLLHSQWKGERTHIEGKLNEVRPGRFIRSALAGMTALTPKLIDSHPDLVGAVRHGVAAPAPEGIRLLAAIAPDGAAAVLEGAHEGLALKLSRDGGRDDEWTTTTTPTISAVIHFPPFSLLLADRQLVSALPHADCTDWLEHAIPRRGILRGSFLPRHVEVAGDLTYLDPVRAADPKYGSIR